MIPARHLFLFLMLSVVFAGCSNATDPVTETKSAPTSASESGRDGDLQGKLDAWVADEDLVGAVALLTTADGDTTRAASGWADREAGERSDVVDTYRIASITKMFTATIVLTLVDDGLVALESSVSEFVDGADPSISIEQLLSHTSGIEDGDASDAIRELLSNGAQIPTPEEARDEVTHAEPVTEPGSRQEYANTNFMLLGLLIESVTGETYAEALASRITGPLGLSDTGLEDEATDVVTSYERLSVDQPSVSLAGLPTGVVAANAWSAGAIVSTLGDLAQFTSVLFSGEIVSEEMLSRMLDVDSGVRSGYGLGISSYRNGDTITFGHNGRTVGFSSSLRYDPATGAMVIVLANDGSAPAPSFADELISQALQ